MKRISLRLISEHTRSPYRNNLYKNSKVNIPIRIDMRILICYTITVAGTCVQALGTFLV